MADVQAAIADWSTTASSNSPSDATTIGAGLADNFQQIQATVRTAFASKGADIASATTTDLGAVAGLAHDITGTTTITGLGTVAAGIWKIIKFEGALTLTHNATSLILPGGANITTADGDVGIFVSEGSGNWRCVSYSRASQAPVSTGSWSPVYAGLTGSQGSLVYTASGTYTKIGRQVIANGRIVLTDKGSWTGQVVIQNLPFAASASWCAYVNSGTTTFYIDVSKPSTARAVLTAAQVNNDSTFYFTVIYTV
jgi:hypothetical protein